MHLLHVVGARPNFMKIAPILAAVRARGFARQTLVHTGQHYDAQMSDVFFQDLGMPAPDAHLGAGGGTHAQQTAKVLLAIEPVLERDRPDLVLVAGDVNSTLAVALAAAKLCIPVGHVEAGLRSRDWTMPEEVNRVLTDRLSTLLFTPSRDGDRNLLDEGIEPGRIHFVGNVMIDSLRAALPLARERGVLSRHGLQRAGFALATLHRPSNVDEPAQLARVLEALSAVAQRLPVLFPIHPRTRARIDAEPRLRALLEAAPALRCLEPLGYLDFLALLDGARLVLTDSGGIQEETTALAVPCLTLRENTERPITVEQGTNRLVGSDPARIVPAALEVLAAPPPPPRLPELWDGAAAGRIAEVIAAFAAGPAPQAGRG